MPEPAKIPQGLATKLGKYGAIGFAVLAALAQAFDVQLDTETMAGLAGSLVLLVTTMAGRYAQAAAQYKDAPSPAQLDDSTDEEDELDEEVPAEGDLAEEFPADAPVVPLPEVLAETELERLSVEADAVVPPETRKPTMPRKPE